MTPFRTLRTLSFGNGTRRAGFVLGQLAEPEKAVAAAQSFECKLSDLGECELAEGVTGDEAICALRNDRFLEFVDEEATQPDESGTDPNKVPNIDWRNKPLSEIEEIDAGELKTLKEQEPPITTLGELYVFGEKNEGFTVIAGFGPVADEKLKAILIKHMADQDEDPLQDPE